MVPHGCIGFGGGEMLSNKIATLGINKIMGGLPYSASAGMGEPPSRENPDL